MRRYVDRRGYAWDIVLGRESWGNLFALFVPAAGNPEPEIRQALLASSSHVEAEAEIDAMDESAIAELFIRSQPRGDV